MSTTMQVRDSETGVVRLFALDLPPREAERLKDTPDQIAALLGVAEIASDQIDLFATDDLAGLGLSAYLAEGHGISEADLAPHASLLAAQEGALMILRSAAITTRPATLTPKAPLRWIATFGEDRPKVPLTSDLDTASARGAQTAPPAKGTPGGVFWIAITGLLLTAAVLVTLWLIL